MLSLSLYFSLSLRFSTIHCWGWTSFLKKITAKSLEIYKSSSHFMKASTCTYIHTYIHTCIKDSGLIFNTSNCQEPVYEGHLSLDGHLVIEPLNCTKDTSDYRTILHSFFLFFFSFFSFSSFFVDLMTKLEELRSTGCHGECIDSIGDTLLQWVHNVIHLSILIGAR